MEIKEVYVKTRAQFGKQCIFDLTDPIMDMEILPNPSDVNQYVTRSHCHVGVQHSKQLALHEITDASTTMGELKDSQRVPVITIPRSERVLKPRFTWKAQTIGKSSRNTGIFHFEGGWPKEINPRDEETTTRFRRRVEKDDNWAPKLRNLFEVMERGILQNSAVNIYQHYFDDMIATDLVQPLGLRTVNVYMDPEKPNRPVTNISWSPDSGSRIVISYCFLEFGRRIDYSNTMYIWQVGNPNEPYMALEPFCPSVVCEFNPRDPSVLASGLMTGQVCNWDLRTGTTPVQFSHLQFSHRGYANGVKWLPTKSNTEFFSTSSDGRAMWWDTRWLHHPTETLMFDLENPNEPDIDRAIGVSCLNYGPMVGTKFMFGMDNGVILTGSRKAKTNAEKLAVKFPAHYGPVLSVDRNVFNPSVFLSVGDWTARIWAEDTREGNLVSTVFLLEYPTGGCWNKARQSVFYVITASGRLIAWDLIQSLQQPLFTLQLCNESLTTMAPYEEGTYFAIGNSVGTVFLVESMDFLQSFDRKDRGVLSEYLERCSKLTKAVDVRLRELRLVQKIYAEEKKEAAEAVKPKVKQKTKRKSAFEIRDRDLDSKASKDRRKSGVKEKKKVRDDFPDLADAEQKYFEIVEQELDMYEAKGEPEICPSRQVFGPSKKQDRRRRKSQQAPDDDHSKPDRKKSSRGKKILVEAAEDPRRKQSMRQLSRLSKLRSKTGASIHPVKEEDSRMITEEPGRRTKRKQKVLFVLPKPCKSEVCQPKVCCWRVSRRKKGKKRPSRESVNVSVTGLMDNSSLRLPKPRRGSRRSLILKEMLSPPSVLVHEVQKAKREIKEAVRPKDRPIRRIDRAPICRPKKSSRKRTLLKLKDIQKKDSVDEDAKTEEPTDDEGRRKKVVIVDPCSPREAKDIAEEFSKILDIPVPESIEEEVEGTTYFEKPEAARARVYPRVSGFQAGE